MGAPKAPDPVATAQAQAGMNKETAITQSLLGMTNQVTPFGSLTWNRIGSWGAPPPAPAATPMSSPMAQAAPQTKTLWEDGNRTQRISGTSPTATSGQRSTSSAYQPNPDLYDVPRFEAVQTLSPELQGTVDNFLGTANALSGQLKDTLGRPIDLSGLPDRVNNVSLRDVGTSLGFTGPDQLYSYGGDNPIQMSVGANDWSADRQRVEDALMSRLNPQLDRDRSSREADLRARGIAPGSGRAYDGAVDELNRQSNDARMSAILAGGQEQSRLAGLELAQGQFANSAQQQAYQQAMERAGFSNAAQQVAFGQNLTGKQFERDGIGINNQNALTSANFQNAARAAGLEELFATRQEPVNTISALLSGTQLSGPKFQQTPQPGVNGVDYTGLVNQQYQSKLQNYQGMLGGLAGIGSSLIGALPFSDRRLKKNIMRIDTAANGLPWYTFTYAWEPDSAVHEGFMSDDVKKVIPLAVVTDPDTGFDRVDYDEAFRKAA